MWCKSKHHKGIQKLHLSAETEHSDEEEKYAFLTRFVLLKMQKHSLHAKYYPNTILTTLLVHNPLLTANHHPQQVVYLFNCFPFKYGFLSTQQIQQHIATDSSQTMESLIKQTRGRFPSRRQQDINKDDITGTRDRNVPPQQPQSYREKRRSQSWIRRQFSRQMSTSSDYDHTASDYPAAVAAAAYAIQSLEESRGRDYRDRTKSRPDRRSYAMTKEQDNIAAPEPPRSALRSSDQSSKKSFKDPDIKVPISSLATHKAPEKKMSHKKKLSFADADETIPTQYNEPVVETKRPMRKPSTFSADKQLNITEEPKPYRPPTPLPRGQVQPVDTIMSQRMTRPRPADSQADAWEKEEMAVIRERYEKMKATIDDWENKKKAKAKRKMERTEAKLERRRIEADTSASNTSYWEKKKAEMDKKRIKSAQSYRIEVKRIEGIAGGARTQAEENQRREESKIREKANKIRATGKLPTTCLCF